MVPKDSQPLGTTIFQWSCLLVITGTIVAGGFYLYTNGSLKALATKSEQEEPDIVQAKPKPAEPNTIAALGRIEPKGEIVRVSSSSALETPKVEQLAVQEGDTVRAGQVIAVLDGVDRRQAALDRAKSGVQVAQAKLQRVRAGNSDGDINAQRAAIARIEAELNNAKVEYERNSGLYTEGAISKSILDAKRLSMEVAEQQLNQAKQSLDSISEVRPEDVLVAQAEVDSAISAVKQAEADLSLTYVRSPMTGQVIKVHTHPGEVVGQEGILQMAQTSQMYVIAQVYETDIDKVRVGQRATVTSTSFDDELKGSVEEISRQVIRQNVFENNPFANTDNRVVEVKVRLEGASSARVSGLSNLQVQVVINRS